MTTADTQRVPLSCGELEYIDSGGSGPILVLLHGLLMDHTLWSAVVEDLTPDHRCIVPILPLGAHQIPTAEGFAVTTVTVASLVTELLENRDLRDVTLVGNDTGGALIQVLAAEQDLHRVGRLVLASCDAFDNFPPGLTGKTLVLTGRLPPRLFGLFMQQLRLRALRRLPIAFGWLTKRGDATCRPWLTPILHDQSIRRDTVEMLRSIRDDKQLLERAAASLEDIRIPTLIVWAAGDRVMPPDHAHRLGALLHAEVVEVDDSYTLLPLDQPHQLAAIIRRFLARR